MARLAVRIAPLLLAAPKIAPLPAPRPRRLESPLQLAPVRLPRLLALARPLKARPPPLLARPLLPTAPAA